MEPIGRRRLLQGAFSALLPSVGWSCSAKAPKSTRPGPSAASLATPLSTVGLQLYTVRELLVADPVGTLEAVAATGYREVEFAGYHGLTPTQWKAELDRLGLTAPAAHFHLNIFQDALEAAVENAVTLGHHTLVMPFTPEEFRTPEGYRQMAAVLNDAAQTAAPSGVQVAFHNHDFDFQSFPDEPLLGYDILAAELDPNLVKLELDTYWIEITGHSSIAYLQRYAGRFRMCHLKDTSPFLAMEDVGYGTLDWPSIIDAARAAGVQHFIVEHDQPSDPLASASRSFGYLTGAS
jgi:sugar phosphate isomerase/epimerase